MKDRLYYQDPYIKTFETHIKLQGQDDSGRSFVILENTAFYPSGGGQPYDTGTLNGKQVLDVQVDGEDVRHYLNEPLPDSVTLVHGEIDWDRRFDHMQQHAGQHVLSAAFADLFNYQTVSFHLGQDIVTIDLDTTQVSKVELEHAQAFANQIVLANHPITIQWVEEEDLANYPLRKAPKVKEQIRLVIIEGFDYNACGGTHPARTGEVGPIHILGTEKIKEKTRVIFLCGLRAIKRFDEQHEILQALSHTLMRPQADLHSMVEAILEQEKRLKSELEEAKKALINHEAELLIKNAPSLLHGEKLVAQFFIERPLSELQQLTYAIKDQEPNSYVLLTVTNEDKLQFIAARGQQLELNMNNLVKGLLPLINGRGGGKPDHVQGGGAVTMTASALLEHMKKALVGKETLT